MFLPPNNQKSNFQTVPQGNHVAICYRLLDLGTQKNETFGSMQRRIILGFEMVELKDDDGRPMVISSNYNFSSNESATLRLHLEAWRGKKFTDSDFGDGGFDIKTIVGVPCILSVTHKPKKTGDGVWAEISSIAGLPKSMEVPAIENEKQIVVLDKADFDPAAFETVPEYYKEKMKVSPEWAELISRPSSEHGGAVMAGHSAARNEADAIPF